MKLEEAIKVLEEMEYELDNLIWNESICSNENIKALNVAVETLKKYRWHDLRDNPNDLPDVKHRRKAYFHVAQAGKETRPAILQYKKDFGFGIYNEFGNGPKFTGIDTDLIAPVVAWKEIEEFESEGEE